MTGRTPPSGGTAIGWISEVVLDAPDPWALARFWAGLLGGTPAEWYPGWVTLEPPPHGQRLSFQGTATPLARDTRPAPDGEPVPWRVYRDPAGHPFCLVVR